MFLDADTIPCVSPLRLYTQVFHNLAQSHIAAVQRRNSSIWELNSGVIFWRRVQAMIHVWNQWLYNYKEKYTSVQERGGSIQLVRDQSSLLSALLTYRLQVKVNPLGPEWNCKPLLRESLPQQHSCCNLRSIRCIIDHKCY
jgi:hypothetical protein